MARRIRQYAVTIPTGTTATAPHKVKLTVPPWALTKVSIRVPPGPRGVMGFAVGNAAQTVIPEVAGTWIVTDDQVITWDLTDYTTSGTWWVLGYNTGTHPHTIELTFSLTLPASATSSATAPLTPGAISTPGGGTGGATGVAVGTLPTAPTGTLPAAPTVPATAPIPIVPAVTLPTTSTVPSPPAVTLPAPPALGSSTTAIPPPPTPGPQVAVLAGSTWYVLGGFTPQGFYVGRTVSGGAPVAFTWSGQGTPEIGQLPPRYATGVTLYTPTTTPLAQIGSSHGPVTASWSQQYSGTA